MAATWVSEPELETLIGKNEARLLCQSYGGVPFYIPATLELTSRHAFAPVIGIGAMCVLCGAFPGERIAFPNARRAEALKTSIVNMLEDGHTQSRIALELGCTTRWVEMVASRMRNAERQCRLPL